MKYFLSVFFAALLFTACTNNGDEVVKDMEKPVISDGAVPSPIDCQVYKKGETIAVRYTFTDNVELGNYNIEIHNNFDHHSHSTSAVECEFFPIKSAVNPFIYNKTFSIPQGSKTYEAKADIVIPTNIDSGDYHFEITVSDQAGWQQLKSVSIKIVD